jgi:hypothetical protein
MPEVEDPVAAAAAAKAAAARPTMLRARRRARAVHTRHHARTLQYSTAVNSYEDLNTEYDDATNVEAAVGAQLEGVPLDDFGVISDPTHPGFGLTPEEYIHDIDPMYSRRRTLLQQAGDQPSVAKSSLSRKHLRA